MAVSITRIATILLVPLALVVSSIDANACTCAMKVELTTEEKINRWLYDKAEIVVNGKVKSIFTDTTITKDNVNYISAKFNGLSVLKGDISAGEITIMTPVKNYLCGMAGIFKGIFEKNTEVTIEIKKFGKHKNEVTYVSDICGFFKVGHFSPN